MTSERDQLIRPEYKHMKGSGHRWKECVICGTVAPQGIMVRQDGKLKCPKCVDELTHSHHHKEVLKRLKDDREKPMDFGLGIRSD